MTNVIEVRYTGSTLSWLHGDRWVAVETARYEHKSDTPVTFTLVRAAGGDETTIGYSVTDSSGTRLTTGVLNTSGASIGPLSPGKYVDVTFTPEGSTEKKGRVYVGHVTTSSGGHDWLVSPDGPVPAPLRRVISAFLDADAAAPDEPEACPSTSDDEP